MSTQLIPFSLGSKEIRVVDHNGKPWFVLRDLLEAIGTTTTVTHAIKSIQKNLGDGFSSYTSTFDNLGREQKALIIAEQAFYFLILKSPMTCGFSSQILSGISCYQDIIKALNDFEIPDDFPDMYVYAIREVDTGRIKLGISRNPEQRLRQLQTGNGSKLELIAHRKAENRFDDERAIQGSAKKYHLHGEWFDNRAANILQ